MELKKTPLYIRHSQAKAKIVDFAGWLMPVEYQSTLNEAKAVRNSCGIFDASHMGEIRVSGKNALAFLQQLLSNNLAKLKEYNLQYNLILNGNGGVIDDLMVYRFPNSFLCVVNASNKDKAFNWFLQQKIDEVIIEDESDNTSLIALQGPQSQKIISQLFGDDIANLEYMKFIESSYKGLSFLISRSGYTGEDGFELYASSKDAVFFWDILVAAGKDKGLSLCGLGSRDILRIEAGYPLYGHELNDKINPYEADLSWAVKLDKDFLAKQALLKLKTKGLKRKRIGLIMLDKAVPRQGYQVFFNNICIGEVASGTYSPNLDKFIAMVFVDLEFAVLDTVVELDVRGKRYKAKIVNYPFIDVKTKKKIKNIIIA